MRIENDYIPTVRTVPTSVCGIRDGTAERLTVHIVSVLFNLTAVLKSDVG